MKHPYNVPHYPNNADYTTNAASYYDDLARKNALMKHLAQRIWEYDKELSKRFAEWDHNLATINEDVIQMMIKWMEDGTLDHIINVTLLNQKADQVHVDTIFNQLINDMNEQRVSVKFYGAKGDGVTDDIEAFEQALASGYPVYIPNGHYKVSRGIRLPSNTMISGAGIDNAVISWLDDVPRGESLMSNENINGNDNISVHGFTLDGNARRMGEGVGGSGGSRDSALTFRAVKNGTITRIKTVDTLLHGIDVTCAGLDYPYTGDGTIAPNPSQHILISECDTSGFGDDGISTHHSEYLTITNNFAHDARLRVNCNGIELDDGTRHVMMANNKTARNYCGIEIKAHATSSAAQSVIINGHTSIEEVRAYNFRHIGHHSAEDPDSQTARNIVATGLSCINPNNTRGFQGGTSPRVIAISAFIGVVINGLSAITTMPEHMQDSLIAVQFKARNINLSNLVFTGFTRVGSCIYVTGGGRRADSVNISNVTSFNSGQVVVGIGGSIQNVSVTNISAVNDGSVVSPIAVIRSTNSSLNLQGVSNDGYPVEADIAGQQYTGGLTLFNGGLRAASTSSGYIHPQGFVMGSTGQSSSEAVRTGVMSSSGSNAKAEYSNILASLDCTTEEEGRGNVILGSSASQASGNRNSIINSYGIQTNGSYKVNGGFGEPVDGVGQSSNIKWELDSLNGNIKASGTMTGATVFSDYGEYFESVSGEAIPTGTLVTLEHSKIRPAQEGEPIIGVISETAGVVLGESTWSWQDEFLKNEFGGLIKEYQEVKNLIEDTDGNTVEGKPTMELMPVRNPAYDPSQSYRSRADRKEWNIVGLMGQMFIRTDSTVEVGKGVSAKKGIATLGDTGIVMTITQPYSHEKGYGVAKILLK